MQRQDAPPEARAVSSLRPQPTTMPKAALQQARGDSVFFVPVLYQHRDTDMDFHCALRQVLSIDTPEIKLPKLFIKIKFNHRLGIRNRCAPYLGIFQYRIGRIFTRWNMRDSALEIKTGGECERTLGRRIPRRIGIK